MFLRARIQTLILTDFNIGKEQIKAELSKQNLKVSDLVISNTRSYFRADLRFLKSKGLLRLQRFPAGYFDYPTPAGKKSLSPRRRQPSPKRTPSSRSQKRPWYAHYD